MVTLTAFLMCSVDDSYIVGIYKMSKTPELCNNSEKEAFQVIFQLAVGGGALNELTAYAESVHEAF